MLPVIALQRNARVDVVVREETAVGRVEQLGGRVRTSVEVVTASLQERHLNTSLTDGTELNSDLALVQIGFLSAKETFEWLAIRLNEDGSIAIDPYFETSRRGIFAVGDVHGDIKLVTVA